MEIQVQESLEWSNMHIEAIGYDYTQLNETIKKLKGEKIEEVVNTTIDLDIDGYIPASYIEDEEQKIDIYKKIAVIENLEDYRELIDELIDRFGDLPIEVKNLLDISYVKNMASTCHIDNIYQSDYILVLEFSSINMYLDLIHYLSKEYGRRIIFDLSNDPSFKYRFRKNMLTELKGLVEKISGFHNMPNNI